MKIAPTRIGRYKVVRLLGQGGMGRVWLARDTVLGRHVAIKVLRDDLALAPSIADELVARMGHEARAAAAVSHPNIVTLHDMGEDDIVGLFLVFEYVTATGNNDPLSLRDRLKEGALPLADVAQLAREVGSALSFAHEAGVIHRDVKPENILFSRTGFKIADFGIARIPESTITRANTVLGTPAYTAPEALSRGEFGASSDQFALAATLYEAATGKSAFGGEDAIATAGKVSSEPPPPLSPSLAPESTLTALDAALSKGLAKSADARFASCAELGQEVARAIESETRRPRTFLTPTPGILEVERTPLSSRAANRTSLIDQLGPPGMTDTQRLSLYTRKRTHRFQNIAAGIALVVILVLILMGRKTPPPAEEPAASATTAAPKPKPRPSAKPLPSAAPPDGSVDAGD
jgi:eukaryotic-like serine/threonine-protein kinase